MMKKIFKQNINKIIIIAVWLLIWQAAASLTGLELILAGLSMCLRHYAQSWVKKIFT